MDEKFNWQQTADDLEQPRVFTKKQKVVFVFVIICLLFSIFYYFFLSAPRSFPTGYYNLKYGDTLSSVSNDLSVMQNIRSPFLFKSFVYVFSFGQPKIISGSYLFSRKQNVMSLAWRISHGDFQMVQIKVTIPEGLNSFEIADVFYKNLPSFNKKTFLDIVKKQNLEGYLFPDTYFFLPSTKENEIVKVMNDNFNEQIKTKMADIKKFGKSLSDVIKMASILEEEARTLESREMVAGILWRRISIKMALQVDSSFKYINGKTTKDLSTLDLQIDSPYNSYTNRGLPPTPISNPGLMAIEAAIKPIKSQYLYFLTDKQGNMHYAVTFEEHVANKMKYLK